MEIIFSSVIRSSKKGNAHGGLYRLDLDSKDFNLLMSWDSPNINWEGRGGERGLRGIAKFKKQIIVASNDSIHFLNSEFEISETFTHELLKDCHEIYCYQNDLYITSTGYNLILVLNMDTKIWSHGFQLKHILYKNKITRKLLYNFKFISSLFPFNLKRIDLSKKNHITYDDIFHINNVFVDKTGIYLSGTGLSYLLRFNNKKLSKHCNVPLGTHNCMPYDRDSVIYNDTVNGRCIIKSILDDSIIKIIDWTHLLKEANITESMNVARNNFNRGLELTNNRIVIGTSPASIIVVNRHDYTVDKIINISEDIRNAIHGIQAI